jgi:hypothetical protein
MSQDEIADAANAGTYWARQRSLRTRQGVWFNGALEIELATAL